MKVSKLEDISTEIIKSKQHKEKGFKNEQRHRDCATIMFVLSELQKQKKCRTEKIF